MISFFSLSATTAYQIMYCQGGCHNMSLPGLHDVKQRKLWSCVTHSLEPLTLSTNNWYAVSANMISNLREFCFTVYGLLLAICEEAVMSVGCEHLAKQDLGILSFSLDWLQFSQSLFHHETFFIGNSRRCWLRRPWCMTLSLYTTLYGVDHALLSDPLKFR